MINVPSLHCILSGLSGLDLSSLGIPTEDEFLSKYCQLRGLSSIPNWSFYMAFSFFRVAAILQGVYKRSLQSNLYTRTRIMMIMLGKN